MPVAEQGSQPTSVGAADKNFSQHYCDLRHQTKIELSTEAVDRIRIVSDCEIHELQRSTPPDWACDFGQDQFGIYAAFELSPGKDSEAIRQYLRWIPAGRFKMGSPETEPGRSGNETPHDVVLTDGFWMFDSPCPQQLWQLVMGDNPSRFVDPRRPVEQVSWEESVRFTQKVSDLVGLEFSLPTEAQWEYSCRAGTSSAIYTGRSISNLRADSLSELDAYRLVPWKLRPPVRPFRRV